MSPELIELICCIGSFMLVFIIPAIISEILHDKNDDGYTEANDIYED